MCVCVCARVFLISKSAFQHPGHCLTNTRVFMQMRSFILRHLQHIRNVISQKIGQAKERVIHCLNLPTFTCRDSTMKLDISRGRSFSFLFLSFRTIAQTEYSGHNFARDIFRVKLNDIFTSECTISILSTRANTYIKRLETSQTENHNDDMNL